MLDIKKRKYKENLEVALPIIMIVAVISKMIEHLFLPMKYYYDNIRICGMVSPTEDSMTAWGGTYQVAADFFKSINYFNFSTVFQWSIFLGIIFNIVILIMVSRTKGLDNMQCIFIFMYTGILNIYIFNIGKDIIQFMIFIIMALILACNIPKTAKVIGCFLVLYWESTFYRDYYIIMAFFFLCVYAGLRFIKAKKIKINKFKVVIVIALLFVMVFVFLAIAQVLMPEEYDEIMTCKDASTDLGATSVIEDVIDHNGNLTLYMENYIINTFRLAFPVELLTNGVYYLPFVVFEIFMIFYIVKAFKRLYTMDAKQIISLSVFIAYFMGSVLFEPDFGSFVRHEAATFPIIYFFILHPDNWNIKKEEIYEEIY